MAGVKLTGDWKSFESMIGKTITKMRHTQTLTEAIGETLVASTKERFENEERPDGTKWDKSIRAQAEGGQTLTDRAVLKGSIGYEASPKQVAVGTVEVYGAIHQFGGKAGRGRKVTIPERAFLGISEDDRDETKGVVEDFMAEGLI